MAFSAIRSNDRVGMVCFSDQVELVVPPRKGPRHVLRIVRDLLAFQPRHRGTDVAAAVEHANRLLSRRAVLFVVSDFVNGARAHPAGKEPWEDALRLARSRHDVIPVVVRDPRERELPNIGLVEFEDEETGRRMVADLGSRSMRDRFAALADAERTLLLDTFRRLRTEPVMVETGMDFVEPLTAFFRRREMRRGR
ncbi:MAG: VWA domain-containing protein [Phycisphaerae bacterium]|nr:VWA domain-containing protein [Phycisphaerae bacterium]